MTREDQYTFTLTSGRIVGLISGALCALLAVFVAGLAIGRNSVREVSTPAVAAAPEPAQAEKAEPAEVSLPEVPKQAARRPAPSPTRRTAVAPTTTSQPPSKPTSASGTLYTICVLSARQRDGAERYANQLRQEGYKADVRSTRQASGTVWYRTLVGEFADRKTADQQLAELKKQKKFSDAFVTTK